MSGSTLVVVLDWMMPKIDGLELLRWLDPAQSPRIAIGTQATLTNS